MLRRPETIIAKRGVGLKVRVAEATTPVSSVSEAHILPRSVSTKSHVYFGGNFSWPSTFNSGTTIMVAVP